MALLVTGKAEMSLVTGKAETSMVTGKAQKKAIQSVPELVGKLVQQ